MCLEETFRVPGSLLTTCRDQFCMELFSQRFDCLSTEIAGSVFHTEESQILLELHLSLLGAASVQLPVEKIWVDPWPPHLMTEGPGAGSPVASSVDLHARKAQIDRHLRTVQNCAYRLFGNPRGSSQFGGIPISSLLGVPAEQGLSEPVCVASERRKENRKDAEGLLQLLAVLPSAGELQRIVLSLSPDERAQLQIENREEILRNHLAFSTTKIYEEQDGAEEGNGKKRWKSERPMKTEDLYRLVYFVMSSCPLTLKVIAPSDLQRRLKRLLPTTLQLGVLSNGATREDRFQRRKSAAGERQKSSGSFFAFHGSPVWKCYSILRNGLRDLSGSELMTSGAAFGDGIYCANSAFKALQYCGGVFVSTRDGVTAKVRTPYAKDESCPQLILGVVEILDQPDCWDTMAGSGGIWCVKDESAVCLRYLLAVPPHPLSCFRRDRVVSPFDDNGIAMRYISDLGVEDAVKWMMQGEKEKAKLAGWVEEAPEGVFSFLDAPLPVSAECVSMQSSALSIEGSTESMGGASAPSEFPFPSLSPKRKRNKNSKGMRGSLEMDTASLSLGRECRE
uniref:PARP catalytic domain-containing protein n=1 Tax=Chromera velia CCMP2878 TaxID=1169474 RepID=A0A0G4HQC7_9ALVE|eukprot:Cvel_30151.t1-p1 / transcript=Cvel_30151.t1 / gene=Cvel_30151 / organism=Chromera_velia_CCMP2878 / gene_product=Poly [ADP-ribose] polymerase 8, putative / transcript_product=Poly [ADP-ribose] polymerase 8, putative / location=Cvel_scaffold4258:3634-7140(-) / protein_length=563 / sequence_SO=supercontig / SO=protein_coding / is_pseudo=false